MKKVRITARAVSLVERYANWLESESGPGFVPVIMWQVTDSSNPHFVAQLTVGFERHDVVDRTRVMECEGKEVEIFQYAPDELFEMDGQKFVDVKDDMLVIVDKKEHAP